MRWTARDRRVPALFHGQSPRDRRYVGWPPRELCSVHLRDGGILLDRFPPASAVLRPARRVLALSRYYDDPESLSDKPCTSICPVPVRHQFGITISGVAHVIVQDCGASGAPPLRGLRSGVRPQVPVRMEQDLRWIPCLAFIAVMVSFIPDSCALRHQNYQRIRSTSIRSKAPH